METDIGNPIDYNPATDPFKDQGKDEDSTPINDQSLQQNDQYYFQPSEMMYPQQQFQPYPERADFLTGVDKSTWIIAFAVFLLGFFMGKTMQPVILRYAWVWNKVTNVPINRDNLPCNITIHNLCWIHWHDKRIASILNKSMSCAHLLISPTFVFWRHTLFKKQNKERTCQKYGHKNFPHFALKLTNIIFRLMKLLVHPHP